MKAILTHGALAAAALVLCGPALGQDGPGTPTRGNPLSIDIPPSSVANVPLEATDTPAGSDDARDVANRYLDRARAEPDQAQAWTFCSAVALKRSAATPEESDAYARDAATRLQANAADPATSPCPDAISQGEWDAARATVQAGEGAPPPAPRPTRTAVAAEPFTDTAAPAPEPDPNALSIIEAERLRALNAAADARAREQAARYTEEARAREERVAAQNAQYDRDRATYEAAADRAAAERAAYEASMEAYRRAVDGRSPR